MLNGHFLQYVYVVWEPCGNIINPMKPTKFIVNIWQVCKRTYYTNKGNTKQLNRMGKNEG